MLCGLLTWVQDRNYFLPWERNNPEPLAISYQSTPRFGEFHSNKEDSRLLQAACANETDEEVTTVDQIGHLRALVSNPFYMACTFYVSFLYYVAIGVVFWTTLLVSKLYEVDLATANISCATTAVTSIVSGIVFGALITEKIAEGFAFQKSFTVSHGPILPATPQLKFLIVLARSISFVTTLAFDE